jgi:hypothetical protein
MIEGLRVTVPGTEVKALLEERAKYHSQRSSDYRRTWETLSAAMGSLQEEDMPKMSSMNNDPVAQAKAGIERHTAKEKENTFMAKFVKTEEDFLLGTEDLHRLGVIESRY